MPNMDKRKRMKKNYSKTVEKQPDRGLMMYKLLRFAYN